MIGEVLTATLRRPKTVDAAGWLALPAAVSAGIVLSEPAKAQSVIAASKYSTVNLSTYGANAVTISSGITIAPGAGAALLASGVAGPLVNAGRVAAANGTGIDLQSGGQIGNNSTGVITASSYGIRVNGAFGSVSNAGTIAAGYDGISLNRGGAVTNAASGVITGGHIGVYTGLNGGSIANAGMITAQTGDAVSLYNGGTFSNAAGGQVIGGYSGVYAAAGGSRIQNAGTISGPMFGVYLNGAVSVVNSGTITGGLIGLVDVGQGGEVMNTGRISSPGTALRLGQGASLSNSGVISGGQTGALLFAGSSVENAGTIAGATAIMFSGGPSSLTLESGAQIDGTINGGGTASQITLQGTGTLSSNIMGFGAGSALNIAPMASWAASGTWAIANVTNSGIFQPGFVGAPLALTGNFTQSSGATLRVAVSPAGAVPFAVMGQVRLAGGLVYVLAPGSYAPAQETFLTATGGITGGFTSVSTNQPAQSQIVAAAISPAASTDISPAASTAILTINQSFTVAPVDADLFANTNRVAAFDAAAAGDMLLTHANAPSSCLAAAPALANSQAAMAAAQALCRAGGWLAATGSAISATRAISTQGGGVIAGIDRPFGPFGTRLGIAAGYDETNLKDSDGGKSSLQTMRIGIYAAQALGAFQLTGEILDGLTAEQTSRPTGSGTAAGRTRGNVLQAGFEIARPWQMGGTTITPSAGLKLAELSIGRITENTPNAAFALTAGASNRLSLRPFASLTLTRAFTAGAVTLTPSATAGVDYEAGNPSHAVALTSADGTLFQGTGAVLGRAAGSFAAGLTARGAGWSIGAAYCAAISGNWSEQTAEATLRIAF